MTKNEKKCCLANSAPVHCISTSVCPCLFPDPLYPCRVEAVNTNIPTMIMVE